MKFIVEESILSGEVKIPGSKSHTIRALVAGLLADGCSEILDPLVSSDTTSCVEMVTCMGADVSREGTVWKVRGTGGNLPVPTNVIDVGNSGTSLYIGMGISALCGGYTVFTGDSQIRNRPAEGLVRSLNDLGAHCVSTRNNGRAPFVIRGPIKGGETNLEAVTSQYLTALLMASPLASGDTVINVPLLNEKPYVTMTLGWLDHLGLVYQNDDYRTFRISGRQGYKPFSMNIAADFSSATFFLVAGAILGGPVTCLGLDMDDSQGDKEVVNILRDMGADVAVNKSSITVRGGDLKGRVIDLNAIPDALPALAVAGCFASGETRLVNVPQARLKETDRIRVMREELSKLGADIEELPDGLVIRKSRLHPAAVEGRGDHRVVMALSVAGMAIKGGLEISTAEAVSVTFPEFSRLMAGIGGRITSKEDAHAC